MNIADMLAKALKGVEMDSELKGLATKFGIKLAMSGNKAEILKRALKAGLEDEPVAAQTNSRQTRPTVEVLGVKARS